MATPPSNSAALTRIQENWLARHERRLLIWLCSKMPPSVTPDKLTALGMVGAFMIFVGYVASNLASSWLMLSLAGYAVQWFGDSMDGSLARFRKIERPSYGYFIDHSCDGLANLMIVAGIGLSPFVTMDIAMVALAGYLLMSVHAFLSARVTGELRLSYVAAGPTELRLMLIAMTVAMWIVGPGHDQVGPVPAFDTFVGAIAVILITLFVVQTAIIGRRLAVQERR
jgi:phosphatidylglycerophosphate synthase